MEYNETESLKVQLEFYYDQGFGVGKQGMHVQTRITRQQLSDFYG